MGKGWGTKIAKPDEHFLRLNNPDFRIFTRHNWDYMIIAFALLVYATDLSLRWRLRRVTPLSCPWLSPSSEPRTTSIAKISRPSN